MPPVLPVVVVGVHINQQRSLLFFLVSRQNDVYRSKPQRIAKRQRRKKGRYFAARSGSSDTGPQILSRE